MAALKYVDHANYHALLLRRSFPELEGADGLIAKAHEWFGGFRDSGEVHWNEQKHRWTFPSGSSIQFGHVQDEAAVYRYQGQAYQFVGFDELTHFTERQYEYIAFTRARRVKDHVLAGIPVQARSASNPGNVGHAWVKRRFITHSAPGVIFIPAKVRDNPGLDTVQYAEDLSHMPEELRKQLMDGDWDAHEGAAFTINPDHLVDRFAMSNAHDRFEACDYGLNGAPWGLWTIDFEGNLVVTDLLYVSDLLPSDLAPLVLAKRKEGWGFGHRAVADPSIWHRTGSKNRFGQPAVLADEFSDNGVALEKANNDPRAGMMRLRELLKLDPHHRFPPWHPKAGQTGAPRLFFVRGVTDLLVEELRTAPVQPIDKADAGEKVDPVWESAHGHACAMARYAVMTRPSPSTPPPLPDRPVVESEQRADFLNRFYARRDRKTRERSTYIA